MPAFAPADSIACGGLFRGWEYHRSKSGAFESRFPRKFKQKIRALRQNPESVIYNNEYIAQMGNDPNPNKNMLYVIKVEQTMGLTIPHWKIRKMLKAESERLVSGMEKGGAVLRSLTDIDESGMLGQEFFFTYNNNGDNVGMRIKIMHSDVSKIEQVLTGPPESMYSYRSNDFFDSLKLYDGFSDEKGTPGEGWEKNTSPRKIFTVTTPPDEKSFNLGAFEFVESPGREEGKMIFVDPVLHYETYYDVYGYKMDKMYTTGRIKAFLYNNHIAKYGVTYKSVDALKFDIKRYTDSTVVSVILKVQGLPSRSYANMVYIHGTFKGPYAMIQEVSGNNSIVSAPLFSTLISLAELHPEKYDANVSPDEPGEQPSPAQ